MVAQRCLGRHALFLARAGFSVDAIEPSAVAVETVAAIAAREQLAIRTHHGGFEQFAPPAMPYGGVLLFGILLVFTGVQLVTLGLLAEMQARTYHESQNKPVYTIRQVLGAGDDGP